MRVNVLTGSRWVTCVAKDRTASNRTTRTERHCLLEKAHLLRARCSSAMTAPAVPCESMPKQDAEWRSSVMLCGRPVAGSLARKPERSNAVAPVDHGLPNPPLRIPFLQNIISLLICTHRPTDHSFIIQWQTKVTMSRSYQAGRPEPTVGPAQPPGSIAGRCWLATDNSRNRISEIPALWHISDILHFCKLTFCQHAVRQQPGSATIAMNLGTPPKL